eukprot:7815230-Alexandrium_andersonii.AAC.1
MVTMMMMTMVMVMVVVKKTETKTKTKTKTTTKEKNKTRSSSHSVWELPNTFWPLSGFRLLTCTGILRTLPKERPAVKQVIA